MIPESLGGRAGLCRTVSGHATNSTRNVYRGDFVAPDGRGGRYGRHPGIGCLGQRAGSQDSGAVERSSCRRPLDVDFYL